MFYRIFFFFIFLISNSYECDIWKAAECPQGPSIDDEDLMKSQLYTQEQLLAYCDAGKTYADCVNEHLLCCDMRTEYAAALASLDIQLRRNALRVGRYCADMNETNPIQYRCRTTLQTLPGKRYRRTTTATPVCNINKAGKQCSPIIENRVRFDRRWSAQEKAKWCKDTYEYHTCTLSYITNCTITPVAGDVAQLTVFLDYIEKSANRECPGGLFGCSDKSDDDIRCQDRISYFLDKNALSNQTIMTQLSSRTLFFVIFILSFCQKNHVNNSTSFTPTNNIYLPCNRQTEKIQNYSQFRCAAYQRVNNFFYISFSFVKKQTNILAPHPGRFYIHQQTNMKHDSHVQQYSRYRDAEYHSTRKNSVFHDQKIGIPSYSQISARNENEYSRYRSARSSRERSVTPINKTLKTHFICRSLNYDTEAQRFQFSNDKVSWNVHYPDYKPVEYTTAKVLKNPKADSSDPSKIKKYNQIDNKIDRRSFTGCYYVDPITNRPRNPMGRTGMTGRGRLYYWGPNHAGDPVVTRWKRDENGSKVYRQMDSNSPQKPVLEFVAILRRDIKQWAAPGGMVDPGENVSETVKREFQEEALREGLDPNSIKQLFSNGYKLYESYVDDPRNTDNAWMESVAMHFHDETGQLTNHLDLTARDDAEGVVWCPIDRTIELYACHKEFIKIAVDRLDAFW